MKKYKTIAILISMLTPSIASAANCVEFGPGKSIDELIGQLFNWSIWMAGLIVFGALVYGGFLWLVSAGNSQKVTQAKTYMTGAIIGMVILLGSVLLLNTLNPQILGDVGEPEPPRHGICLYTAEDSDGNQTRCCYNESTKELPEDLEFENMTFRSINNDIKGAYWFTEEDWPQDSCNYKFNQRSDYDSDPSEISVGGIESFYLDQNDPGVFLYTDTLGGMGQQCDASNFPHSPYSRHQTPKDTLGDEYRNNSKALKIRHLGCEERDGEWLPKIGYGAVLHSETNYEGVCSIIRPDTTDVSGGCSGGPQSNSLCAEGCIDDLESLSGIEGSNLYEVGYETSGITPFVYNYDGAADSDRVIFYEEVSYEGDRIVVEGSDIENYWNNEIDYPVTEGNLSGARVVAGETTAIREQDPQVDRILSVKIEGNLMVALGKDTGYSKRSFGDRCEIITESVPNLKGHYVLNWPEDDQVEDIGIVPLDKGLDFDN